MVASSILTGVLTGKVGYYTPFMIVGICIMSVAAGLLTTLELDTPQAKWVGYQFFYGFGMGMCFQAPNLAAQTVLSRKDASIGVSLMFFGQLLGGAIFTSVGQNVLNNKLLQRLAHVPGFNASTITNSGATSLTQLSPRLRSVILPAYNDALSYVFTVGLAIGCCSIIGALTMEWISVKNKKPAADAEECLEKGASEDGGSCKDATAEKKEPAEPVDEKEGATEDNHAAEKAKDEAP
jgi:MFS family permease